jgi:hypothetical protein
VDDHHSRSGPREAGVSYVRARRPAGPTDGKNGRYRPELTPVRRLLFATTRSNEGNPLSDMSERDCYVDLFGVGGAALSDAAWIARANDCLPPNLSALNARFVTGSRRERLLQVSHRPGPESFTFFSLSGECVAEMLDQAAAHCGTFVTSHGCPTLTMTVNYMHAGGGRKRVCRHGSPADRDKRCGSAWSRAGRRTRRADRVGVRRRTAGQGHHSVPVMMFTARRRCEILCRSPEMLCAAG